MAEGGTDVPEDPIGDFDDVFFARCRKEKKETDSRQRTRDRRYKKRHKKEASVPRRNRRTVEVAVSRSVAYS